MARGRRGLLAQTGCSRRSKGGGREGGGGDHHLPLPARDYAFDIFIESRRGRLRCLECLFHICATLEMRHAHFREIIMTENDEIMRGVRCLL